jgi:STE24 endopeptidase
MIILSVVFSYAALWILSELGNEWWLWLWIFLSVLSLIGVALAPVLKQVFNKYTPIKDKNLKKNIEKLLKRCGFESSGLFEMNGSLRSTHGNAFFGGFGKTKRIIFFDTLLEKLNTKEIEAVIAHELGHFKRNHVKKLLLIQISLIFFSLYFLGGLKENEAFYNGLGVESLSDANFLILFILVLLPFVMFFVGPFISWLQRKYEFEADEYACEFTKSSDLKQSLLKLYRDNASTLTPDPLYSAFYHSHPPASIRIQAIDKS